MSVGRGVGVGVSVGVGVGVLVGVGVAVDVEVGVKVGVGVKVAVGVGVLVALERPSRCKMFGLLYARLAPTRDSEACEFGIPPVQAANPTNRTMAAAMMGTNEWKTELRAAIRFLDDIELSAMFLRWRMMAPAGSSPDRSLWTAQCIPLRAAWLSGFISRARLK